MENLFVRILFFLLSTLSSAQVPLIIITASYNNKPWLDLYFNSIARQKYDNWSLLYIDDNSTDGSVEKILELMHSFEGPQKITILRNLKRKGHAYNQYHAIHTCPKNAIIVIIDGDDWLAHDEVFQAVDAAYQNPEVWLTYGQFWYIKKNKKGFCRPIPADILENGGIRTVSWRTSHLRTFYAGLFQQIRYEDFFYEGNWFPKCVDVATMFPMIEMATTHVHFIPEILYMYNDDNPISYHHDPTHQRAIEAYIRTMPPYSPLKEKPW